MEKTKIDLELEKLIKRFALKNALEFKGKASAGAVIGKVLSVRKDLRERAKEVGLIVKKIVEEINLLSYQEQERAFEEFRPLSEKEKKREEKKNLPPLKNAEKGVVMRFAPSPSGPLHIGHTRACILNDEYVKRYGGEFILRLEDTNPKNIEIEAYQMIQEDLDWLGVEYHKVVIQSERMELYHHWAERLLEIEKAYVCDCDVEFWRKRKLEKKACPHRNSPSEENLSRWEKMLEGDYREGEASFVIKTNLHDPNPALRDFVGMRIVETPHPRTGDIYRVYPLYNFSVAIDDHLLGVTHVLRGKDHLNNTFRQKYIYKYLGWKEPEFYHYGWVSIPEVELKTSNIKKKIKNKEYTGWDDVRLGSLAALRKRGIQPEALREYWKKVGMNPIDIKFSWKTLFSYNRNLIDKKANRYFFTAGPKKMKIFGKEALRARAPLHPDFPERGFRELVLKGNAGGEEGFVFLFIDEKDFEEIKSEIEKGSYLLRLKDLCNIVVEAVTPAQEVKAKYAGNDLSVLKRGVKIIHWTPPDSLPCTVNMPDGRIVEGVVEPLILKEKSEIVQFERFGFVRFEKRDKKVEAFYAHR